MLIKQVQFKGIDDQGHIFCQPLKVGSGMEKTAEALEMRSKLHPRVQDFIRNIIPTPAGIYVLVNALGAGEYWGSNVNGDLFPEKALIHSPPEWENLLVTPDRAREIGAQWPYGYPTFMKAYPYKHHVNKDPSRAFGRVELATWNPIMHRVELVIYLDRALCMQWDALDVIERIEKGEFPDVSMGCKVPYDVCTICEHRSKTTEDYCVHAATMMNKILPDGRKVAVRNDFPNFFDISFVFIGADKTAKVMAKLAQVGKQVCMGDFCTVPRLSAVVGAQFSKVANNNEDTLNWSPMTKERAADELIMRKRMLQNQAAKTETSDQPERNFDATVESIKTANDPIKKKIEVSGVPVYLEWLKGQTREYKNKKTGKVAYSRLMKADYGYIPGTRDADGEELDAYVGPDRSSKKAYVINQLKKDGSFDEHKVMIGYASKEDAKASYVYHMGGTPERFGGMEEVPVSALKALFGENTEKTASSCSCGGIGDDCGGGLEKIAAAVFPVQVKSASHAKLSELIKTIPAGPFSKQTLPRLESVERNIPDDVLNQMGEMPLGSALSTPAMAGMVLKPREFQRIILIRMGERQLADDMDRQGQTFGRSNEVDEVPVHEHQVDEGLLELLSRLGLIRGRSAAAPALQHRASASADKPFKPISEPTTVSSDSLMKKMAAAYNGYRRSMLKKAASIAQFMTTHPQLRADLFGSSMAEAFAGGMDKVATASVLSPDSLAYLVGAYTDRDLHVTSKEVVSSLALTGAIAEAA